MKVQHSTSNLLIYLVIACIAVDFGHLEFISLLGSTKFQEKSVGYMAVALLLKPGDEMITLVINSGTHFTSLHLTLLCLT